MDYRALIDRSRTHYRRSDVTPIFADPAAFAALVDDLARPFLDRQVARVAGLDALGFILGTAIALKLGVGFIPIRKGGKLPVARDQETVTDYSGKEKTLELRVNPFPAGTRVLLVDEWVDTGGQAKAAIALLERAGATIVGLTAVTIRENPGTAELKQRYFCHSVA